ncbi:uncharacterized protein FFB20_04271 [Fusarium fujikuroi]|nr:uncharacterized protein FFE2_00735 [Fusarium fujikuroi]SCN69959.1 uncharacterized protein FFC1_00731 [Fusarium fujikuroi]SCN72944.1 uncharacterized protein FFB20_04271 [Fusarium fujikuroi]SCN73516.1 uncharacterized protein FFM5_00692 [Fusarium fujikuroi]SCO29110.1 uncharacterized protein FFNC_00732 [Fusarium fujikuroi]
MSTSAANGHAENQPTSVEERSNTLPDTSFVTSAVQNPPAFGEDSIDTPWRELWRNGYQLPT